MKHVCCLLLMFPDFFFFLKKRCSPVSPRPGNGGGGGSGGGGEGGEDFDSPRKFPSTKDVSRTGRSVNPFLAVREVLPLHLDDFDADKRLGLVGGVLF